MWGRVTRCQEEDLLGLKPQGRSSSKGRPVEVCSQRLGPQGLVVQWAVSTWIALGPSVRASPQGKADLDFSTFLGLPGVSCVTAGISSLSWCW